MDQEAKIPFQLSTKQTLEVDEKEFDEKFIDFIDKLENTSYLDKEEYNYFLSLGVNKSELDAMVKEVKIYSSYNENPTEIGFPYESWRDRILTVYETTDMTNQRILASQTLNAKKEN